MPGDEKTIAFYRIVKYNPAGNEPMEQADWYEVLTAIGSLKINARTTKVGSRVLIGEVYFHDERAHLNLRRCATSPHGWDF